MAAAERIDGVEVRAFRDAAAFDRWLERHHGRVSGVWVKVAKVASGIPSVTADELVDVGLCWGWISGQRRALDSDWYLQHYVPRRRGSLWSQVNVDKVERLAAEGRMRPPGLAEVDAARADGRWAIAYAGQATAEPPPELVAALADDPTARSAFDALGATERYQLYLRILQARTDQARAARLARALAVLRAAPSGGQGQAGARGR